MTQSEAKEIGFTHMGLMYLIFPIYYEEQEMNVVGINWFIDLILDWVIEIDVFFGLSNNFIIKPIKEL